MRGEIQITVPELTLVAGTRAALGVGLGLLLAGALSDEQRRSVGWTLLLVGAATTIPLAFEVFGRARPFRLAFGQEGRGTSPSRNNSELTSPRWPGTDAPWRERGGARPACVSTAPDLSTRRAAPATN